MFMLFVVLFGGRDVDACVRTCECALQRVCVI